MTEQRAPAGFWRFPKVAQLLTVLLYSVHVLVCIFLIFVVLLQQGKGADLSVFGGGTTQTAFGARGATTLLHKLTVGSFIIFVITTLAIGLPQLHNRGTVMSGAKATKPAAANPVKTVPVKPAPAAPGAPAPAAPATPASAPGSPH
jgi:preprotein translocase subunit SecG